MIDFETLQKVIELSSQSTLAKLEVCDGTYRICVVNAPKATAWLDTKSTPQPAPPHPTTPSHTIASSAVGCLCFDGISIKVGDTLAVGDILAGVMALGVLSPIKADKAGVLRQFLLGEGDKVQWGQAIAMIDL